jgi:RNA polymerase-binding transcription factor DksA
MTDIDITTQKNTLESLKAAIVTELATMAVHNEATDDWEARFDFANNDEADSDLLGDAAEAAEERIATLALLETRYRNIVRALTKIDNGTYGICEISGEHIEPDRLLANPAARTCKAHLDDEIDLPL